MKTETTQCSAGLLACVGSGRPPHVVCGLIGWECPLGPAPSLAHSHVQAVFGSIHPLQLLKVFPSIPDVDESGCRCWEEQRKACLKGPFWFPLHGYGWKRSNLPLTNGGVWHDDHDVGVGGKDVNEGCKVGVAHFHALERRCQFAVWTKTKQNLDVKTGTDDVGKRQTHLQLSLNCLIILLIFSKRWTSRCSLHW